jgi:cytoskeleton protein RodZ
LGVGRALSEARKAQGLELADIAQQLKFMPRQIESLEAERFDSLPGPTIARGMVRTYARFLKIDPEPLLDKMAGRVEPRDATPQLTARFNQPVPFSESGKRSTVVYLALSFIVLVVAGVVFYQWRHEHAAPAFVTPEKLAQEEEKKPEESTQAVEEPEAKPAPVVQVQKPVPVVQAPKPAPVEPAPKPAPAPAAPVAAAAPKPAPAEPLPVVQAPPRTGGANRLVLHFEQDAWVEVIDATGRNLVSSLNRAGTDRSVRVSPPFNLVIGNASHVKVTYNNKPIDLAPHTKVEVARFTVK